MKMDMTKPALTVPVVRYHLLNVELLRVCQTKENTVWWIFILIGLQESSGLVLMKKKGRRRIRVTPLSYSNITKMQSKDKQHNERIQLTIFYFSSTRIANLKFPREYWLTSPDWGYLWGFMRKEVFHKSGGRHDEIHFADGWLFFCSGQFEGLSFQIKDIQKVIYIANCHSTCLNTVVLMPFNNA